MQVIQIFIQRSYQNFNYIVFSDTDQLGIKKAIHFDPYDIKQTLPSAGEKGLEIHYLLNTHQHWDHIKDNEKLIKATGCQLITLNHNETLSLSDTEYVKALSTPGHVAQHQVYLLFENDKPFGLIAGDTLFNAGVGNCKNGGNVNELYQTTSEVIYSLPDDIKVYPSHDYMQTNLEFAKSVEPDNKEIDVFLERRKSGYFVTTIGDEKKVNPFLRVNNPELQKHFPGMGPKEIFFDLRKRRDCW